MQQYPTVPEPQQAPQQPDLNPQQVPPQSPPSFAPPPYAQAPMPNQPFAPIPPNPSNTPRSNRNKVLIGGGIGCGVLLVLCMCVGLLSALAANGSTSANVNGSPTSPHQSQTQASAGTPKPTAAPKPTATATPQPKWMVTHTYKGNGIQKTEPFTVNSDHWKIAWSCNPKAYGFEYNLIADLTQPGQDFGDSVVNVICKSNDPSSTSGVTNEYSSGTFFLDVTSEGPWTFQIEELK